MFKTIVKQSQTAIILLFFFTLVTGLIYPLLVTAIAQWVFPWQANGSLIEKNKKLIGSLLIGQSFTNPKYFWGRPSATENYPYNALSSGGSNWGATNPIYLNEIKSRITKLRTADPENNDLIPIDLITASGSGLDPEISPLAAFYQVSRIAKSRGVPEATIRSLIRYVMYERRFRILGEPRVNVLELNLVLDNIANKETYGATTS